MISFSATCRLLSRLICGENRRRCEVDDVLEEIRERAERKTEACSDEKLFKMLAADAAERERERGRTFTSSPPSTHLIKL